MISLCYAGDTIPNQRKSLLLRLDPAVHDALARWAADDLRSSNAQIEFLLRKALADAGRLPAGAGRPGSVGLVTQRGTSSGRPRRGRGPAEKAG